MLLVRTGAIGDMIMMTPVFRALKKAGWHLTLFTTERAWQIVKHDPNIDAVVFYTRPENDPSPKWEQVDKIKDQYDDVINLSGHLEEKLLVTKGRPAWNWEHHKRHNACNLNYVENHLAMVEHLEESTAPELFFTPLEHSEAKRFMKKYRGKFLVMWLLAGSAFHKIYPFQEFVARKLMDTYPEIHIHTHGGGIESFLEWNHPKTKNYSGKWPIRKSMIMTKYVQCVVGTETGVMNAASCFDTPKVLMLSHSSVENLSRDWQNTHNIEALDVACHPCHKLAFDLEDCPLDHELKSPLCMARIKPLQVFRAVEEEYLKWKAKRAR